MNKLFKEYAVIKSLKIIVDYLTNRSRRLCFVEMPDATEAEKAIKSLNRIMLDGRTIKVIESKPKSSAW